MYFFFGGFEIRFLRHGLVHLACGLMNQRFNSAKSPALQIRKKMTSVFLNLKA